MKKLNLRGYCIGPFYPAGERGIGPGPETSSAQHSANDLDYLQDVSVDWDGGVVRGRGTVWFGEALGMEGG